MELQLEAIEPEQGTSQQYPILYYKGFARGSYTPEAAVSGSVRVLKDGQIRWTFVSLFVYKSTAG